jgi:hypothetical protein
VYFFGVGVVKHFAKVEFSVAKKLGKHFFTIMWYAFMVDCVCVCARARAYVRACVGGGGACCNMNR